jgi:hypothetical protein
MYLAHVPIPSNRALLDALAHMHHAHPKLNLPRPIFFFISSSFFHPTTKAPLMERSST